CNLLLERTAHHLYILSVPTRRSSDLVDASGRGVCVDPGLCAICSRRVGNTGADCTSLAFGRRRDVSLRPQPNVRGTHLGGSGAGSYSGSTPPATVRCCFSFDLGNLCSLVRRTEAETPVWC